MIMIVISVLALSILVVWLYGFFYANDLHVPVTRVPAAKRVAVIFPHADDEALNAGGFIASLADHGAQVHWMILTQGEKGTPEGTLDPALRQIRTNEARTVATIFGINPPVQRTLPDGGVAEHHAELGAEVSQFLEEVQPDLILTYDLAGMYGHSDHIAVAEVVTALAHERHLPLWYISYPKRLIDAMTLPEHMAKDPAFKQRRVYPTVRIWVGPKGIIRKVRAMYAHKSQRDSYHKSFPIRWLPMWSFVTLTPFEYYHAVASDQAASNTD